MPKKKKETTKPAASAAKSEPQVRDSPTTQTTVGGVSSTESEEDWKTKNARAKELIMSTLIPGSEPWKIAVSLENASDIWKALEAKYAPNGVDEAPDSSPAQGVAAESVSSAAINDDAPEGSGEAQSSAIKEFYSSMPNQDQRLLWALLHGGKPETDAWFYGNVAST